jgi:hypothetical protein
VRRPLNTFNVTLFVVEILPLGYGNVDAGDGDDDDNGNSESAQSGDSHVKRDKLLEELKATHGVYVLGEAEKIDIIQGVLNSCRRIHARHVARSKR